MSEAQLLETLHFKTITVEKEKFLHSVPITCHISNEDKAKLENAERIGLKGSNGKTLAVIEKPVFY